MVTGQFASKIYVLDTTLRDGDQAPGMHLSQEKKLDLAKKLDEIGVSVIEGGNAAVSQGERDALKQMAAADLDAELFSFARIVKGDIDAVAESGCDGVHLVFPSSELHIKAKLKKTPGEAKKDILDSAQYALDKGLVVELSAEDGSRADPAFLQELYKDAAKLGVERFCICDTVGILTPEKSFELYLGVKKAVGSKRLAVHCHNDLGMATANTLAALRAGCGEFHATVNGVGERTGNCALEEVAAALDVLYQKPVLETKKLYELSNYARALTGFPLAPNKPVVGENAFSHESGIHVDGLLKDVRTYEGLVPEAVGRKRKIVLGKMSGRKAIALKLEEFGIIADKEQQEKIFEKVKDAGDRGKTISDADLLAIAQHCKGNGEFEKIKVEDLQVTIENKSAPTAAVKIRVKDENGERLLAGMEKGTGPVNASMNAIYAACGRKDIELTDYRVEAITGGSDALVDVKVRMRRGQKEISSGAVGSDIVLASVEAMVKAMNALM